MNRLLMFMNVLLIFVCIVLGTTFGSLLGLLLGFGALAIPGFGPTIAAGSFSTMLSTAAIGAVPGMLLGGLVGVLLMHRSLKQEQH